MLKHFSLIFLSIIILSFSHTSNAGITLEELFYNNDDLFHLKILDAIPDEAKIEHGPENAKNIIIEFMDYFCGYCKKIHLELIGIVENRNDVKVIFVQHPILSESSLILSKYVIAANLQNKGFELHHSIFTIKGSLTQEKLEKAIIDSGVNVPKLKIDSEKPNTEKAIKLTSFIAGGLGARGTPSLFINEEFIGGYISKDQIIGLLKK